MDFLRMKPYRCTQAINNDFSVDLRQKITPYIQSRSNN